MSGAVIRWAAVTGGGALGQANGRFVHGAARLWSRGIVGAIAASLAVLACYAVAEGSTAPGDPEHWTIHDGRLYLNCNAETQGRWEADREAYIARANDNWPKVAE